MASVLSCATRTLDGATHTASKSASDVIANSSPAAPPLSPLPYSPNCCYYYYFYININQSIMENDRRFAVSKDNALANTIHSDWPASGSLLRQGGVGGGRLVAITIWD